VLFRRQPPSPERGHRQAQRGGWGRAPSARRPHPGAFGARFHGSRGSKSLALNNRAVTTRHVAELFEHQWLNYLTRDNIRVIVLDLQRAIQAPKS